MNTKHNPNRSQTIFLHDFTQIDCAMLYPGDGPKGQSWNVSMLCKGNLNDKGMIFDFSDAKRHAKLITKKMLDHKLIVRTSVLKQTKSKRFVACEKLDPKGDHRWFVINTYAESITSVPDQYFSPNLLTKYLENHLAALIAAQLPSNIQSVEISLSDLSENENYLNYTHALADHAGDCQRYHGHSGLLAVNLNDAYDSRLSRKAVARIQNSLFMTELYNTCIGNSSLYEEMVTCFPQISKAEVKDYFAFINYQGTMGEVAIWCPSDLPVWVGKKTTVENLSAHLKNCLELPSEASILLYEGIGKGAVS